MSKPATQVLPLGAADMPAPKRSGDLIFRGLTMASAAMIGVIFLLVAYVLLHGAREAMGKFGWSFLVSQDWDTDNEKFGALPFIYGTLVTSALALLIAVPLSLGTAIFLTDLAPFRWRQPLTSIIEMLAAVPSVIWGFWGLFVLVPWLAGTPDADGKMHGVYPFLRYTVGAMPSYLGLPLLFKGPISGTCMLSAGIIVAIMILPIVTSVSREILRSVPDLQREAAYGLGATRWEVTRIAVLSYARRGLMGAAVLGLGRALGETMAVTMVIGNNPKIEASLLHPGYTLASVIANQFSEAMNDTSRSVLYEIGLVLVGVTIITNIAALILIKSFETPGSRRT